MKLFFSVLLHDEINLDEAKGGQQARTLQYVQNDYFSDYFSKD